MAEGIKNTRFEQPLGFDLPLRKYYLMHMAKRFFPLVLLLAAGLNPSLCRAQIADSSATPRMVPIQTFPARAALLAKLPGSKTQAVLRILRVAENKAAVKDGDELLARFYFTTDSLRHQKELTGIQKGDTISFRMSGSYQRQSGQYQYRVYHYRHLP